MRMRTHKNPYTTISNAAVRDEDLSWEAVGFLAYCLSMPEDWEFHPKQIWKKNTGKGAGINKIYSMISELIAHKKCIRVQNGQLKNSFTYEMIDDEDFYDKRVEELRNSDQIFLYAQEKGTAIESHGKRELKEKLQRSDFQNAEFQNAENSDNTKKEEKKERALQSSPPTPKTKKDPDVPCQQKAAACQKETIPYLGKDKKLCSITRSEIHRAFIGKGVSCEMIEQAIVKFSERKSISINPIRIIEYIISDMMSTTSVIKDSLQESIDTRKKDEEERLRRLEEHKKKPKRIIEW